VFCQNIYIIYVVLLIDKYIIIYFEKEVFVSLLIDFLYVYVVVLYYIKRTETPPPESFLKKRKTLEEIRARRSERISLNKKVK